jgi:hypothetical protein
MCVVVCQAVQVMDIMCMNLWNELVPGHVLLIVSIRLLELLQRLHHDTHTHTHNTQHAGALILGPVEHERYFRVAFDALKDVVPTLAQDFDVLMSDMATSGISRLQKYITHVHRV